MPARKVKRGGKAGYLYHGRWWSARQWRAKWATGGFRRQPRKRR